MQIMKIYTSQLTCGHVLKFYFLFQKDAYYYNLNYMSVSKIKNFTGRFLNVLRVYCCRLMKLNNNFEKKKHHPIKAIQSIFLIEINLSFIFRSSQIFPALQLMYSSFL
jgi:hypothetical protein